MKIAICEDNIHDLKILVNYINTYCTRNNTQGKITCYSCGEDLLAQKTFNDYDVIFLDIYMKQITGMKVASLIHEQGYNGTFVFTTSSVDHVFESFLVNVTDYLVKPYDYERFLVTMDKLMKLNKSNLLSINVMVDKIDTPIYLRDIYSIETGLDHSTLIHLKDKTLQSRTLINHIEKELSPYDNFIRCHRSYIINMNYVECVTNSEIVMQNGTCALLTVRNATIMKQKIARFISTR